MLQAIAILGGWLLMMGQHDRSESLFYYFRIEDQVPENHLLRFIDRYVSFDFVREKLRASTISAAVKLVKQLLQRFLRSSAGLVLNRDCNLRRLAAVDLRPEPPLRAAGFG